MLSTPLLKNASITFRIYCILAATTRQRPIFFQEWPHINMQLTQPPLQPEAVTYCCNKAWSVLTTWHILCPPSSERKVITLTRGVPARVHVAVANWSFAPSAIVGTIMLHGIIRPFSPGWYGNGAVALLLYGLTIASDVPGLLETTRATSLR